MVARKEIPDKVIFTIAMPGELVQRVDNYRYSHHIPTRAEAIRTMLERELERDKQSSK